MPRVFGKYVSITVIVSSVLCKLNRQMADIEYIFHSVEIPSQEVFAITMPRDRDR